MEIDEMKVLTLMHLRREYIKWQGPHCPICPRDKSSPVHESKSLCRDKILSPRLVSSHEQFIQLFQGQSSKTANHRASFNSPKYLDSLPFLPWK